MSHKQAKSFLEVIEAQKKLFVGGLPERRDAILEVFHGIQPGADPKELTTLHRLVHNVSGAGGTFGFQELSALARPIAARLRERSEGEETRVIDSDELQSLTQELAPLLEALSAPSAG